MKFSISAFIKLLHVCTRKNGDKGTAANKTSFQIKACVTHVIPYASLKLAQKIRLLIRYFRAYHALVFYSLTNSYQLRIITISNVKTNASV